MAKATGVEVARLSVKVGPDTKRFGRDLKSDLDRIEQSMKATIDVDADMSGFRHRVRAATSGLSATIDVDANTKVLSRQLANVSDQVNNSFGTASAGMQGSLRGGPAAIAAIAAAALAATPLIAGSLGVLVTTLMALPGLVAAVAVPIGALALGMDGLKKSAEVLKQPFEDLKATMSARVQEQFTPVFEKLLAIFPSLSRTLPNVTQGLADIGKSIAGVFTEPAIMQVFEDTIDNIANGLKEAAPGMGDFAKGFLDLVNGFSQKLPDVGKWFSETGASFRTWVEDFTTVGPEGASKFDKALSGLGDTLKILGGGLVEVGGKALDFFSNPEKIKAFKTELDGVVNTVLTLVDGINSLAGVMSKIPGFSDGSADSPMDFAPLQIQLLKEKLGEVNWSSVWDALKISAAAAFAAVTASAGSFVANITSTFSSIGASISGAWSGLAAAAQGAWNGVVGTVQSAWGNITSAVQTGVANVVSFVSTLPSTIQGFFADAGTWLLEAGRNVVQGLINGITEMIGNAVAKATELASSVKNAVTGFLGIKSPSRVFMEIGGHTADGFAIGLENGFQPVLDQAKAMAQAVADAFASGANPSANIAGFSKTEIDRMEKALSFESKRLEVQAKALSYQASLSGDDTLKQRAKEIRMQKDQIGLQKDMLGITQDYSSELGSASEDVDPLVKAASGLMSAPVNFATATGKQFMSDIGISGNGLISRAVSEGISYVFQIGSVDEALSIKDREEANQAMSVIGR
jgi:phage-related protein